MTRLYLLSLLLLAAPAFGQHGPSMPANSATAEVDALSIKQQWNPGTLAVQGELYNWTVGSGPAMFRLPQREDSYSLMFYGGTADGGPILSVTCAGQIKVRGKVVKERSAVANALREAWRKSCGR